MTCLSAQSWWVLCHRLWQICHKWWVEKDLWEGYLIELHWGFRSAIMTPSNNLSFSCNLDVWGPYILYHHFHTKAWCQCYNYCEHKTQPRAGISSNMVNNPAPPNAPILELSLKIFIKTLYPKPQTFIKAVHCCFSPLPNSFMFNSRLTEKLTNSETGDHLRMTVSPW